MWKNGNQRTLGTHYIFEKPARPVMFTGKELVVFWGKYLAFSKTIKNCR
jgi:hypothetical protein